jgi:hypothetical protein
MAQPVWVLSVDLTTKTASFQTGMADAAKTARGAFSEIGGGAGKMAGEVSGHMRESREGVMLLGEQFGVHLPRALSTFVAELGPIGAAMEAAFPFLAIAALAGILIEHLHSMHEAGEKLTESQIGFGTAANNAFNSLDQKLLQAQIRSDELKGNHLGALQKQLELIDKQSMADLAKQFADLSKAADGVFQGLQKSWYEFGSGSVGAKHALSEFGAEYQMLLSQGKSGEAADLLKGTRESAEKSLASLQKAAAESQALQDMIPKGGMAGTGSLMSLVSSVHGAKMKGVQDEIAAQQQLLSVLNDQGTMQSKIAELAKDDKGNATTQANKGGSEKAAEAGRQAAEAKQQMNAQNIAAEKASADALLTIHRASLEARLSSDIEFAGKERENQLQGNQAELAALNKSGPDYANQVKALNEKTLEINNQYADKVVELRARASVEEYNRDLQVMQEGERQKISNTQEGTAARLAAIDAGIAEEQARNVQDSAFIRDLMNQRNQTMVKMTEEETKLKVEAAKEEASNSEKMAALSIEAEKTAQALIDSSHRVSAEQRVNEEMKIATEEFDLKKQALDKELTALEGSGDAYNNKVKQIQDQEKQLVQQHANEIAQIKENAQKEQNKRILAAEQAQESALAAGLTKSIMGHQSWAKTVTQLGQQVVSGMIENAIKSMLTEDMSKEKDAAAAARKAWNIGVGMGGPAGMILGPVFAASAFASVMAFADGGVVPGTGNHDTVPAMLTPGEGVVPKGVMEGLSNMAKSGGMSGGGAHVSMAAHFAPTVHAMDSEGVDRVLEKHADQFHKQFQRTLRKMNK